MNSNERYNKNINNGNKDQSSDVENKNTITYDEGWESVTDREYAVVASQNFGDENGEESENKKPNKKQKDSPRQFLITIQLILCILIAIAALLIKTFGGEFYTEIRDKYYQSLNNDAVFNDDGGFDLSQFINSSTNDEV